MKNIDGPGLVSVIIPCRNEENYIAKCLDSLVDQDYPKDKLEVLVVDGMSLDSTRQIVSEYSAKHPFIRILDNPDKITPFAMNRGIHHAKGDIIMKVDAHTVYDPRYISNSVRYLHGFKSDNVGGVLKPIFDHKTLIARAIGLSISSPFGVGNSYFRIGSKKPRWVDTVAFGCYRKKIFDKIGFYNEKLVRGQDIELNLRLQRAGGRILLHPDIVGFYYPPSKLIVFLRHSFRNGLWAILPFKYTDALPVRLRHLVPLVFVLSLFGALFFSVLHISFLWLVLGIVLLYGITSLYFSLQIARKEKDSSLLLILPFIFFLFHVSYGVGSLLGVLQCVFVLNFWKKMLQMYFRYASRLHIGPVVKKIIKEIKNGWKKQEWWSFRLPSLFVRGVFHYLIREKNEGIYVMDEDWDNLLILDACRFDLFTQTNWIEGVLEKKISRGSHTWMFLRENFTGFYPDTIYVSSNPFIWEFRYSFYKTVYIAPEEEIEKYGTVLPETVNKAALEVHRLHPNKRLIVHYLQPHDPFIGKIQIEEVKNKDISPFYLFARGKIKKSLLWQAYQDNLKRVLPLVEELTEALSGKTVITSDHGESFGSKVRIFPVRIYGHSGPRIKDLIEIPWFVIDKGPRKKIEVEIEQLFPVEEVAVDESKIREHLRTLGYI
ncbi:MAG: glycosyltransferase [Candidatus Omnitrophica bacterium]|nr:glycosyltransferase [Candidatus Omnitrophota bacterium]